MILELTKGCFDLLALAAHAAQKILEKCSLQMHK